MNQNDGGWTTVTKNDKKRIAKRSQRRRPPPQPLPKTTTTTNDRKNKPLSNNGSSLISNYQSSSVQEENSSLTMDQATQVLEECRTNLSHSSFFKNLKISLLESCNSTGSNESSSSSRIISQIICYGIGNFLGTSVTSTISAPMWQLVCALSIRDYLHHHHQQQEQQQVRKEMDVDTTTLQNNKNEMLEIYYYDPCMTMQEGQLLKEQGVQIITTNERGKRLISSEDDYSTTITLFFMPHCPMTLYTNVLYTNWERLDQVVIFGNNLTEYAHRLEAEPSPGVQLLQVLLPHLEEYPISMTTEDINQMSGYFENAFNDSCVSFFRKNNKTTTRMSSDAEQHVTTTILDDSRNKWPDRPCLDDTEESNGEVI